MTGSGRRGVDGSQPMTPEAWSILEPLIDAVLDLAPEHRQAYIDRVRGDDAELGDALERAIADCRSNDSLLERGAAERFALLLSEEMPTAAWLLDERFLIQREIGRGGMATVYLALDRKHDRQVAVKVLRADAVAAIGAERFLREVKTVARLQHPHVVPLYDSGDDNGRLYYVMPLMTGASLRDRLSLQSRLSLSDVTRIAGEISDALEYAHGQGLVHRDVKPENILFDGERALLADFGIARAAADDEHFTAVGMSMGTPSYMSPEQASGESNVDARSDVYAFACVVYEMLAGAPPFVASSRRAVLAMHLSEAPVSLRDSRPEVPPHMDDAVRRALAKNPAERHPTVREFMIALTGSEVRTDGVRGVAGARRRSASRARVAIGSIAVIAALAVLGTAWQSARHAAAAGQPRRRVAVIPFGSLASDSSDATVRRYAAMVLTQRLARTDSFDILSEAAAEANRTGGAGGQDDALKRVTESLHPDVVITGTFGHLGDSLRLQASIIDGRTGIASQVVTLAARGADTLALIDAVTERVLGSMLPGKLGRWVALTGPPPAYSAYLEYEAGYDFALRTRRGDIGRQYLGRAIAQDSDFVRAYIALADSYFDSGKLDSCEWILNLLERRGPRVSSTDKLLIDEQRAELAGDLDRASEAASQYWIRTSDPYGAHVLGLVELQSLRAASALDAFRAAGKPGFGFTPTGVDGNAYYLSASFHEAGRYVDELAAVRQGLRYSEGHCRCLSFSMFSALAGLHDAARAVQFADSILADAVEPKDAGAANAVRSGASEFRAHGNSRDDTLAARRLGDVSLAWFQHHRTSARSFGRDTSEALTWLLTGNLDSAEAYLRAASRDSMNVAVAGYLGLIAARRHDAVRARAIADSIVRFERKWDRGAATFWHAAIVAALGDSDAAIELLRQSHRRGQSMSEWHRAEPLVSLHSNLQFQELVKARK